MRSITYRPLHNEECSNEDLEQLANMTHDITNLKILQEFLLMVTGFTEHDLVDGEIITKDAAVTFPSLKCSKFNIKYYQANCGEGNYSSVTTSNS